MFGLALGQGQQLAASTVIVSGILTSFFVSGIFAINNVYTPEQYPTSVRATGAGWAQTLSRFGSALAPLIIGYLFPFLGTSGVCTTLAGAFVLAAAAVLILGEETRGKPLEE